MKPVLARHRLFAYGTLQLPKRLQALIDRVPPGISAQLDGFRCGLVARADFPGIVPCQDSTVSGLLLAGLSARELDTLDAYEGELYQRISVLVQTREGSHAAWVYQIVPWARNRVTHEPWTIEGYRTLNGKTRLTYHS